VNAPSGSESWRRSNTTLEARDAFIVLNLLPGVGPRRVRALLERFGDAAAVLSAPAADLARLPGIGESVAEVIHNWTAHCDPDAEIERARRAGVRLVTLADPEYPRLLKEIPDPPPVLYVRGDVEALQARNMIAIVGTRRPTVYGVSVAEMLGAGAALAGWVVASGLALGIDTAAHRAAVESKGRTVAVLGSGISRLHPQQNLSLARRIVETGGAIVSEFPMDFPPSRQTFPMRNRIIAGLSAGVIVVEAGDRSGALITAEQALEQGRTVFAVPGRVDTPQARGCHALLRDGARLVETFHDVIDEFAAFPLLTPAGPAEPHPVQKKTSAVRGTKASDTGSDLHIPPLERKVLDLIRQGEEEVDALIAAAGAPPHEVLSAIGMLELRRLVRQLPGRRVAVRRDENLG